MHQGLKLIHMSVALAATFCLPSVAAAVTAKGAAEILTPAGQYMALTMTIDDDDTTVELTGPDYSWFAFGFDTTSMMGYSLIVQGIDANRAVVEQNLVQRGNPGVPQAMQNIYHFATNHDEPNNITHLSIIRANDTGDANDPVFSPSMTSLDIIWAYSAVATPEAPVPNLTNHGRSGRGVAQIHFAIVPEPTCSALVVFATLTTALTARWRRFNAHVLEMERCGASCCFACCQ